ncbi:heterogene nuclear ribonucleoprotein A0-like [Capsicum annuum]|uniref:heterogeneous nuclear ribonucleoprotein A0-like n=1 Tax=Capsicum annuum TaxID=4072 RepID=UPI001FB0D2A9|nr:heterogeneous nuclear ribonucleoprotein A0-like [Capsicum annuum]
MSHGNFTLAWSPAFITLVRWGTDEEKDGGGRGGRLKGGDRDRVGYIESSREGGEGEGGYRESSGGGSGGEEMLCYVYDNSSFQHEYWILLNWDGGGGGTKICRNTSLDTFLFESRKPWTLVGTQRNKQRKLNSQENTLAFTHQDSTKK